MAEPSTPRSIDPRTVRSPKRSIKDVSVIFDGKLAVAGDPWTGWSVARINWEGDPNKVGHRYNGVEGVDLGVPNSRGVSTWHILPEPLAELVVEAVQVHQGGDGDQRPKRLRRCVNELMAAARAATGEEMAALQLYL